MSSAKCVHLHCGAVTLGYTSGKSSVYTFPLTWKGNWRLWGWSLKALRTWFYFVYICANVWTALCLPRGSGEVTHSTRWRGSGANSHSRTESQGLISVSLPNWFIGLIFKLPVYINIQYYKSKIRPKPQKNPPQNNPTKFWFIFWFEFCCCLLEINNLLTYCRSVKFCHWLLGLVLLKFTVKRLQIK